MSRRHGRVRGFRKVDNTRIERQERLRRRRRCWLNVGAFTLEPYCGTHGRATGWPCRSGHQSQLTGWAGITAEQIIGRLPQSGDAS